MSRLDRVLEWLEDHKPLMEKTARRRAFEASQLAFREGQNRLREEIARGH